MSGDVRPPVDPLSDVTWARLERGLWARMDRGDRPAISAAPPAASRRRWLVPAFAAAAMVAVIAVFADLTGGANEDAPLSHAIVHAPAPPVIAPAPPPPVVGGSDVERTRVVTDSAPSTATFGDVGVELAAQTAIEYAHEPASVHVERGSVWFTVAPRGPRPAFAVYAADATIEVIGTRFRVVRDVEHVIVEVDHGAVRVQFRGTTHTLHDGDRWDSSPPPTAPGKTVVEQDDRARFEQLTALESRDPDAAITGYLALAKKRGTAWAELAAFAAARLAVDRHDTRARSLLDTYLQRHPTGANAADARQLLTRLKGP